VKQRIDYKIAAVTFKAQFTGVPAYLASLVDNYVPTRTLRSADYVHQQSNSFVLVQLLALTLRLFSTHYLTTADLRLHYHLLNSFLKLIYFPMYTVLTSHRHPAPLIHS